MNLERLEKEIKKLAEEYVRKVDDLLKDADDFFKSEEYENFSDLSVSYEYSRLCCDGN